MGFNAIHETVVSDIFETIKDGVRIAGDVVNPKSVRVRNARSLARATSGLTLAFPVICSNTLPIETASMIAKAIERKNVSMLQMAFSAYNITNAKDAVEHLSKFHQNLNLSKMDLDKFMDAMEMLGESSYVYPEDVRAVAEDCKRNLNFVLSNSISDTSLLEYAEITRYGEKRVVKEAIQKPQKYGPYGLRDYTDDEINQAAYDDSPYSSLGKDNARYYLNRKDRQDQENNRNRQSDSQHKDKMRQSNAQHRDRMNQSRSQFDRKMKQADHQFDAKMGQSNSQFDRRMKQADDQFEKKQDQQQRFHDDDMENERIKQRQNAVDSQRQQFTAMLLPSDVKKANEMQPTLMLVQFYVNDKDRDLNVAQQFVCGVKSKLYAVGSDEILNKIITKNVDSDILLKLVKVSTREISFVKDFLLGLDEARLDALSKSRKGSGSRIFKALERRAIKGKIRRSLRMENSAKAISSLVISSEEAEELKKYENIDIYQPRTIIPIMEKLNLLYFAVVDTTAESVDIITDGENEYETYSFTNLERESSDNTYKKVVNLITKVSR